MFHCSVILKYASKYISSFWVYTGYWSVSEVLVKYKHFFPECSYVWLPTETASHLVWNNFPKMYYIYFFFLAHSKFCDWMLSHILSYYVRSKKNQLSPLMVSRYKNITRIWKYLKFCFKLPLILSYYRHINMCMRVGWKVHRLTMMQWSNLTKFFNIHVVSPCGPLFFTTPS